MERTIEVRHVSREIKSEYESFTRKFEELLGRFEPSFFNDIETAPAEVQKRLKNAEGMEGLMLFDIQQHGKLLGLVGAARKAKQYVLGNPLIAMQMTHHDIRAALYAPLRMIVYEAEDHSVRPEYDLPSSLFGQFNNAEVTSVAKSLDLKMENAIGKAEVG
jgi:uncharacterized protein (DUF302 family)